MTHYVYILYSAKLDRYYVGASADVEQRLAFHNHPLETRKFTAKGIPWKLCVSIDFQTKKEALSAERKIKMSKSRIIIEKIISDENFRLDYLNAST